MRKYFWTIGLAVLCATTAGAETIDVATFKVPQGYKTEKKQGALLLTKVTGNSYCLLAVYASVPSAGSLDTDFQQEWQTLVVKTVSPDDSPKVAAETKLNGWQSKAGAAAFQRDDGTSGVAVLNTYSGFNRRFSVLMLANEESCLNDLDRFVSARTLTTPAGTTTAPSTPSSPTASRPPAATAVKSAFTFNTTTFDDGWVSVEQKDWVLSRKGDVTVHLHYPQELTAKYYSDSMEAITVAWNTLVAPRYSAVQGFTKDYSSMSYQRPLLATATATSDIQGKQVYVALFRQADSGWIEVVTPDKQTFLRNFGIDIDRMDEYLGDETWAKLRALHGLNRFAVSAADLKGTWSSNFSGMTQYVNVFTGLSAGATAHASNETFVFGQGGTYNWSLAVADGVVGSQTFQNVKSAGKLTMKGNWQINFSDIEKKPRMYNAYFEVGQAGRRILWLQDSSYGDYSAFLKVK